MSHLSAPPRHSRTVQDFDARLCARSGVLFGRVAAALESEPAGLPLLLEALLPHISGGRLRAPPPLVLQQLVAHLDRQERLQVGWQGQRLRLHACPEGRG